MSVRWLRNGPVALCVALAVLSLLPSTARADEHATFVGARGPAALDLVLEAGGGVIFAAPFGTAAARFGTGVGTYVEARYEAWAIALGHSAIGRVGWGTDVGNDVDLGFALQTSRSSLTLAEGLGGIEFQNMALGNDWVGSAEGLVTFRRSGNADVSVGVAGRWTLGGPRYTTFEQQEFRQDFEFRSVALTVGGEWVVTDDLHVFVRLEASLPVHTEIIPVGYLPTASSGVSWRL